MSVATPWIWDASRQSYYYFNAECNAWVYQDGTQIYYSSTGLSAQSPTATTDYSQPRTVTDISQALNQIDPTATAYGSSSSDHFVFDSSYQTQSHVSNAYTLSSYSTATANPAKALDNDVIQLMKEGKLEKGKFLRAV
jgi:hypothetical protein